MIQNTKVVTTKISLKFPDYFKIEKRKFET